MPFIDTGELFEFFGTTIHIGVNATSLLMLLVALVALWGFVLAVRNKNLLAILFCTGSMLTFGFFALATIFTFGYPDLG